MRISLAVLALTFAAGARAAEPFAILRSADFAPHIDRFNAADSERVVNLVPNAQAWDWLRAQIPLFACPDREIEEIYYFRWWSLRKHIVRTPAGLALTEFLPRRDPISSAVGHHLTEGRWLRDPQLIDDDTRYWLQSGPDGGLQPKYHNYSNWLPFAVYTRYLVNSDRALVVSLLDALVRDYAQWEKDRLTSGGLYWQFDVRDAMEESISGSRTRKNLRPPLNSYQFGNATAIAAIARLAGRDDLARDFEAKAAVLRHLVQQHLWDPDAHFFKVRLEDGSLSDAREEIGFIPWYFSLPEPDRGYGVAWRQFTDGQGFRAPFGVTTAERRHPKFRSHGVGTCEWDGAVWPFATSQTLTALANLLQTYPASDRNITNRDWFDAFHTYTHSQYFDGTPYIGEYLDETTGRWIKVKDGERSRYYNHSTYADLVIAGLVGLHPREDDVVEILSLLPPDTWDWFCLDGVNYHHHTLTIIWDRTGEKFHRGTGLVILSDSKLLARRDTLAPLNAQLP